MELYLDFFWHFKFVMCTHAIQFQILGHQSNAEGPINEPHLNNRLKCPIYCMVPK